MARGKLATARGSRPRVSDRQSSLPFGNKITKPSSAQTSKTSKNLTPSTFDLSKPTKQEIKVGDSTATPSPAPDDVPLKVEDVEDIKQEDQGLAAAGLAIRAQTARPRVEPKSDEEIAAGEIKAVQIKKYWKRKEDERKTKRVHQEGLSLDEKILREFDLSYQYGPCIGMARVQRWKLAHELGLDPPIEVLAVLLNADARNDPNVNRAYVDVLMSGRFMPE